MQLPAGLRTPTTIVLGDRLERNLGSMAAFASDSGIALRPHAKTHKCAEIARRQVALGAVGISVATVGEAEALCRSSSDPDDVFIAYPLWPAPDLVVRLRALAERRRRDEAGDRDAVKVIVGVDSVKSAELLSPLAGVVGVSIEIDCGLRRTGVRPDDSVGLLGVARAIEKARLDLVGAFTFPGQSYAPDGQTAAAADEAAALLQATEILGSEGFAVLDDRFVRSGGSTPSARYSSPSALTEMRPGVYVFNDAQQVELGVATMDDVALVVAATVVSRPAPGRVVLDSGSKVLGPDRPAWVSGHGRLMDWPDARIVGLWEHHAVVSFDGVEERPPDLGEIVAVVPNHVCTAVNLVPELTVVNCAADGEAGDIVETWAVAAGGKNR
jgi:D-serine deaminase-like pyridoxal phosphate-dependent protein